MSAAKNPIQRRLVHESDRALRELRLGLKVLRRNIDTALERLDAGEQVDAHLIVNASMITEQIARWNLARDMLPMATEES